MRFEGVRFRYGSGVEAVRGVSLGVETGERVAIVGQNGAGKSTLVRHLNGICQPSAGTVFVADVPTTGRPIAELAASVGYVFQNPDEQLFASTVAADVEFGPRNLGCSPELARSRALAALETVGLASEAASHPLHLSLSERKRVALAAVLAMHTPVVVLDEPTTGQDARGIAMVAGVVWSLANAGRTVIAITHDMDFAAENFDRVVVMADGQVLADGAPAAVFGDPEVLAQAAVEPPQLVRLAARLGWSGRPLTVEQFVDEFADRR
ncbi:energy-coupling factor ABC transporter ATP-binding protein [Micropruina sp.]|uniref:energy-coupling factor ABC transporter ATP-binding protein n=1 Tax=Micropruina sp. TaxID=2737536 RepID=UPI0039E503E1